MIVSSGRSVAELINIESIGRVWQITTSFFYALRNACVSNIGAPMAAPINF